MKRITAMRSDGTVSESASVRPLEKHVKIYAGKHFYEFDHMLPEKD